jgi:hypothetical protein
MHQPTVHPPPTHPPVVTLMSTRAGPPPGPKKSNFTRYGLNTVTARDRTTVSGQLVGEKLRFVSTVTCRQEGAKVAEVDGLGRSFSVDSCAPVSGCNAVAPLFGTVKPPSDFAGRRYWCCQTSWQPPAPSAAASANAQVFQPVPGRRKTAS